MQTWAYTVSDALLLQIEESHHCNVELQLPALPPRLQKLFVSAVVLPTWELIVSTALTALHLADLAPAAVQPAFAALQRLPSLHTLALSKTHGIEGHLRFLTIGSQLRSLSIIACGLQELPESLGVWATGLTHLPQQPVSLPA